MLADHKRGRMLIVGTNHVRLTARLEGTPNLVDERIERQEYNHER